MLVALCTGLLVAGSTVAKATTIVWENTATAFGTGANWVGGTAPANNLTSDIASFQAATVSFNPQLTGSRSINGLEFTSGTGAWTFSGNSGTRVLTIGSGGIVSNDDSTQTFNQANLGIALGANAAFTSNSTGALSFGSTLASFALSTFTLTLNGSSTNASNAIAEPISGTGGITKDGTGTWTLTGTNTYSGAVNLNGGTLVIAGDRGLGAVPGAATANKVVFNGGTLNTTATFTLNANRGITVNAGTGTFSTNSATTLTYNGILAGAGTLNKSGTGTLSLGGATTNTHTGDINVNAGTLQIAKTVANTAIGDSANVTVASGANLTFTGGVSETIGSLAGGGTVNNTNAAAITLTTGGSNASTTFSGIIQNTGGNLSLTKTGSGIFTLSGANTYTGATTVSAGTLQLGASNVLSDSTAVTVAGGATFDVNSQTESIASLAGAGAVSLGTGALTTAGNANTTFSGTLSGTGSLTKAGSGTLTIGSDLGFGGDLNLTGGTLQFDVSNAFTGAVTIGAGTTLRLSDASLSVDTLNITGNSTIDFAGTASTLSVTNLTISAGVTLTILNWQNAVDYFFAQNWSGAVIDTTGATPMNQVTFNGFTGNDTKWQGYDNQVTPVPEPSTYGAFLLGALAGFFAWRRLVRRPAR